MKKVHVFNAGPCLLPQVAIDHAIEALMDFSGTGISVLSISHRTKEWDAVMDECRACGKSCCTSLTPMKSCSSVAAPLSSSCMLP